MEATPIEGGALRVNGVECRYMLPDQLMMNKELKYVDIFGLWPLISALSTDPGTNIWDPPNLLLSGPKGNGKSLLCAYVAQMYKAPYLSIDCTEETRERHFKGGFVAKSGETPFIFGAAANAIQVANEKGWAVLVLEELNALSNQAQKVVNALTDFRRKLEIPELSLRLELRPNARLFVMATMNPYVYGGTNELNEDLKSRFVELEMPYPPPAAERAILRAMEGLPEGSPYRLPDPTLDMLVNIARETRQGATSYALSPRDLVEVVRIIPRVGWDDAMFLLVQKFTPEDRKVVIDRIQDITRAAPVGSLVDRMQIHQDR